MILCSVAAIIYLWFLSLFLHHPMFSTSANLCLHLCCVIWHSLCFSAIILSAPFLTCLHVSYWLRRGSRYYSILKHCWLISVSVCSLQPQRLARANHIIVFPPSGNLKLIFWLLCQFWFKWVLIWGLKAVFMQVLLSERQATIFEVFTLKAQMFRRIWLTSDLFYFIYLFILCVCVRDDESRIIKMAIYLFIFVAI